MAQAQIRISTSQGGRTYESLGAWGEDVAAKLPLILPYVATTELREQVAANNPPSNILVDGQPSSSANIANAKRRVQLFFLDVEAVARAVEIAATELNRLYTRATGASAATIQIWGRSAAGGTISHERISSLGSVREWLLRNRNPGTYVRLIGPDVPFRRALYYTPPGVKARWQNISRISEKRLGELERGGAKARVVERGARKRVLQIQTGTNVSAIVTRALGSRYGKSVYVSARWIQVPVPSWPGMQKRQQGVPAIAIGWRYHGAVAQV